MSNTQKIVFVTGCSEGGIGFSLCEEYAKHNCKVYATARRLDAMAAFKSPNIEKMALDVTDDENVKSVVQEIIAREGRIDVLVNNAGANCAGPLVDVPVEIAKRAFDTNVLSILRTVQSVLPHMAARKSGTIINLGSISGEIPTAWNGIYSSTKGAIHRLTDVLFQECKPFNVDVILLAPGAIRSNIINTQLAKGINLPEDTIYREFSERIVARTMSSQGSFAMSSQELAKTVVPASLSPKPPRYISLGGHSFVFKVFAWLPKTWVLNLLWDRIVNHPPPQ